MDAALLYTTAILFIWLANGADGSWLMNGPV